MCLLSDCETVEKLCCCNVKCCSPLIFLIKNKNKNIAVAGRKDFVKCYLLFVFVLKEIYPPSLPNQQIQQQARRLEIRKSMQVAILV
jgi:hypothetical protein